MEYIRNIQLNTNCSTCWLASKILQNIMICETAQEMDGSAKHAGKIIAEQKNNISNVDMHNRSHISMLLTRT